MKITEITEGWGEYSNKSNHRMNKFKRNEEVDENWKDTGFGKFAQAAGGAIKRQGADAMNTAMAKMGSGKAQGKQQVQRVVGGVIKNFNRYLGQTNSKATPAALQQYLKALGFQNPVMNEAPQQGDMFGQQQSRNKMGVAQNTATVSQQTDQRNKNDAVKPTQVLNREQLFNIISKNIQQAMQAGTLPKELKKVLGQ